MADYQKTNWQNKPSTSTPINQANLNHMEQGIYDAQHTADQAISKTEEVETLLEALQARQEAATAADMTDTSKVYIYTGSETGYNFGHWYYWNGSAWTDGGAYNSAGVNTDTTLSVSGAPADSKTAGDKITDLKSALTNNATDCINDIITLEKSLYENVNIPKQLERGRYYTGGYFYSLKYVRTRILPAGKYNIVVPSGYVWGATYYESDTSGTTYINERTGDLAITPENPFIISIRLSANTDLTTQDINAINTDISITLVENTPTYPTKTVVSTMINEATAVPIAVEYFGSKIAELYILGDTSKSYFVERYLMTNGVGDISISDGNDWVCWLRTTESNPYVAGEVREIPEYNDSGITAYIVLTDIDESYTGSASISSACLDLKNWELISQYFASNVKFIKQAIGVSTQKIVFLGDSIFGQERNSTSIPSLVGNYLGITTYNCALGGTEGNSHSDAKWTYYDFTELSKAITSGNFTNQQAHISDTGIPSYFADVITQLAALDFSTINIICMTYGGNDYVNSHSDVDTFVSAMCDNINRILTAYPNIRFMMMNPPYKRFLDSETHAFINDGDTRQNNFGETLRDYADSYKEISETVHAPYIDAYNNMGINRYNATQWFITNDGSHPSEQGRKETAKLVSEYLKRMLYD